MSLVYLKNKKLTRTYVYESENYYNPETKKGYSKRKCIGHLDPETGEIVPNYKKGQKAKERAAALPIIELKEISTGVHLLLRKAVDNLKLEPVLESVFPGDTLHIVTIAFYLISEHKALSHVSSWQQHHSNPCQDELLTFKRISELFESITLSLIHTFFESWFSLCDEDGFTLDMASPSSSLKNIPENQPGHNKDGEDLLQANLPLICAISLTNSLAAEMVERYRDSIMDLENRIVSDAEDLAVDLYGVMERRDLAGHRFYVFACFEPEKAAKDLKNFEALLEACRQELLSGKRNKEHEKEYQTYFKVGTCQSGEIKAELNQEAMEDYRKNRAGWLVLASSTLKDPKKALEVFRGKERAETCFDLWKKRLEDYPLNRKISKTMEGKMFGGVIAALIYGELNRILKEADSGKLKSYSVSDVLDEMERLHEIKVKDRRRRYYSRLTKAQKEIFQLFDLAL